MTRDNGRDGLSRHPVPAASTSVLIPDTRPGVAATRDRNILRRASGVRRGKRATNRLALGKGLGHHEDIRP